MIFPWKEDRRHLVSGAHSWARGRNQIIDCTSHIIIMLSAAAAGPTDHHCLCLEFQDTAGSYNHPSPTDTNILMEGGDLAWVKQWVSSIYATKYDNTDPQRRIMKVYHEGQHIAVLLTISTIDHGEISNVLDDILGDVWGTMLTSTSQRWRWSSMSNDWSLRTNKYSALVLFITAYHCQSCDGVYRVYCLSLLSPKKAGR